MLKHLKYVLSAEDRKSIPLMLKELIHCGILEKEIPFYYFTCLLHKKNSGNYRHFMGSKKVKKLYKARFEIVDVLANKRLFADVLKLNDIPQSEILAINNGYEFIFNDVSQILNNSKDLEYVMKKLIDQSKFASVFVKPDDGYGGFNNYKVDLSNVGELVNKLFPLMNNINFIFQEVIQQHDIINNIYDKSVNSLRIHSYKNPETGLIEIPSALMRFGIGGSIVDNISSGGIFVALDVDAWELTGKGRSFLRSGGHFYDRHPDSNVLFDGYKLPYKDEILAIVKKAAKIFQNEVIGWDIAITPIGSLVVEGNTRPHLIMAQMACGGFKNHPVYSRIFADFFIG